MRFPFKKIVMVIGQLTLKTNIKKLIEIFRLNQIWKFEMDNLLFKIFLKIILKI